MVLFVNSCGAVRNGVENNNADIRVRCGCDSTVALTTARLCLYHAYVMCCCDCVARRNEFVVHLMELARSLPPHCTQCGRTHTMATHKLGTGVHSRTKGLYLNIQRTNHQRLQQILNYIRFRENYHHTALCHPGKCIWQHKVKPHLKHYVF